MSIRSTNALRKYTTYLVFLQRRSSLLAYTFQGTLPEVFRLAARWSGRLSLLVYLIAFHVFATNIRPLKNAGERKIHKMVVVFCMLHFIHLGFVGANLQLNNIALVPYKLVGGALAYALILVYPFSFIVFVIV